MPTGADFMGPEGLTSPYFRPGAHSATSPQLCYSDYYTIMPISGILEQLTVYNNVQRKQKRVSCWGFAQDTTVSTYGVSPDPLVRC